MATDNATHLGRDVDFGFTTAHVPPGTHVCHIYEHDDERSDAFVQFLHRGCERGELSAGFSDDIGSEELAARLRKDDSDRWLELARTSDVYFDDGRFSPEIMLDRLRALFRRAREQRFAGLRIIGEMVPTIYDVEGADRLLEYESRVNVVLRDHPMTVMCQYNAHSFTGSTLMDVLKSHPLMVVRGTVVHNPYFVSPESLLNTH